MAQTAPISFRVEPELKAALEKAAADDMRSVSSLIIKTLTEVMRQRGYLPSSAS